MSELQLQLNPIARIHGEPLLELPQDLYIPPDALELVLENFQGPLDLLLYLIRRHNLDVLDIPMAELTRQYMTYIEMMQQNLDDPALVRNIIADGCEKARKLVSETMRDVREAMGLSYG